MDILKDPSNWFPALKQVIYANTATLGLMNKALFEWRQQHDINFLNAGSTTPFNSNQILKDTRKTVARFFNFVESDIALVPSFSQGLNLLLEGLHTSEKVLLLKEDYPSLNWPFESRKFSIVYLKLGEQLEERIHWTIKNERITVFACSIIQWLNGYKINLDFLKKLKTAYPDLLIIMDGTQFCGMEYFDFNSSGLDVLGASGYKWLLAGYGNGFFMVKPKVQHRFKLGSKGYGSGRNTSIQEDKQSFCKKIEPGHLDSLSFGSLTFALKFLMSIGLENIDKQNRKLATHAKRHFAALETLDDFIIKNDQVSTIFAINKANAYNNLISNKVVFARRGDKIRLSFHFYNTIDEIDKIVEFLKK